MLPVGELHLPEKHFQILKEFIAVLKIACILQMKQASHIEGDIYMPNCRAIGRISSL